MTEPQEPRGATPAHLTTEEVSELAFSPETAAAGVLEHVHGCPRCSDEVADLRLVLTELAALPEPALPESVAIRLDAAVVRAWQEADAESEASARAAASAAVAAKRRRPSWRKIAIPLGSLSLIVLAVFGIGALANNNPSASTASGSTAAQPDAQGNDTVTNSALTTWVHDVLPTDSASPKKSAMVESVHCSVGTVPPPRSGYTALTTSQREYRGQPAMLVVYQDTQKPASPTVYAVVYAGFCPSATSEILAQGLVSR